MLGARNGPIPNPREYRHMSAGSLNISTNSQSQMLGPAAPRVDTLARSPPNRQNTSHVPCKFFKSGNCQAGQACPFSHDLSSTTDSVCKYFAKGNCKFGPKCANIHVLPNGLRVNYNRGGSMVGGGHLNLGGRVNPEPYRGQSSGLTNSLYHAQVNTTSPYSPSYSSFANQDDYSPGGRKPEINVPAIDTTYASGPLETYGSPRDEDGINKYGLGLSPNTNGLSVLDAPLPASFDSNGISHYARMGPMASSVPATFSMETPPGSVGTSKHNLPSEALRNLHTSAFGNEATRERFNAASPLSEEYFAKRTLHSLRMQKAKAFPSSLPKAEDEHWDAAFTYEEDYLPETLKDLMTPQEKARRGSKAADEERPAYSFRSAGTPNNDTASKFGSPSNASPSRWSAYFQVRPEAEERDSREKAARASAFGHVGSPLRSSLHPGAIPPRPPQRAHTSGDVPPFLASPPRQSTMSMISQQLQRTRLGRAESNHSEPGGLMPNCATPTRAGAVGSPVGAWRAGLVDHRTHSSGSAGTGSGNGNGRFTTPIEEHERQGKHEGEGKGGESGEVGDALEVFILEVDEGKASGGSNDGQDYKDLEKQSSGGSTSGSTSISSWAGGGYARSPGMGPIGGGRISGNGNRNGVHPTS